VAYWFVHVFDRLVLMQMTGLNSVEIISRPCSTLIFRLFLHLIKHVSVILQG